MIQKVYRRARPIAGRIKRRVLGQGPKPASPVAYVAPAISPQAMNGRTDPFRVAVIGAGNQGRDICTGTLKLAGAQVVAVADRSAEALERLKTEVALPEARFYTDAAELFAQGQQVDLACIATNTLSHLPLARMAVEAGITRLMIEKPMSTSVAEARAFNAFCADRDVTVAINHGRRWSLDYTAIRRYLAADLGAVRQVTVTFGSSGLGMMGVHYLDLVRYLVGDELAWAVGHLDEETQPNKRGAQFHDPEGYGLLGFANGARAFIDFSQDLLYKGKFIVIQTEYGRIEVDERRKAWTVVNQQGRFTFPFVDSAASANYAARVVASLLSGEPPRADGADGVAALEAVIALHLSAQLGHAPVQLPLDEIQQQTEIAFP